ncbi:hypothetical protein Tco_0552163, partial [Tanacetum coccineum]
MIRKTMAQVSRFESSVRWCYGDGEDGGGGSGVVEVARGASGVVDRVDRSDGESFGLRRKNPPKNFSGGGVMVAGGEGGGRINWGRKG